ELVQGYLRPLNAAAVDELVAKFAALETSVAALMQQDRVGTAAAQIMRMADLRYAGQAHELAVAVPARIDVAALATAFGDEHERHYGHRADAEAVECVALRAIGRLAVSNAALRDSGPSHSERLTVGEAKMRPAYFGAACGLIETPVIRRADL